MSKSPAAILESVLHQAAKLADEHRKEAGLRPQYGEPERRDKARDGAPRNWWGPKSYKITLYLKPWEYIKLIDNVNRAGMPSVSKFIRDQCTDAELVPLLEAAGLKRKAGGKVVPIRRKRIERVNVERAAVAARRPAAHYGLPARRKVARLLHA